ncbi:amidase [Exophiala viscosa]|uniref:amidase n=1 Tax=Exophiala viscosa TaxID=2486360 RepID=A0AAN6IHL6_9EURO|nr:amidase [Exophiala viscosa]KAI1626549.1 amidase [Exophiala viscosa]
MVTDWQSRAEAKREAILKSIPEKWRLQKIPSAEEQKDVTGPYIQQFLDEKEVEITETDAVGIAEKVAAGTWSAVSVTEAFCHRASLAHQLVNCLHETFFDAAIASAKELDDYYAQHKKTIGPLHGVPVSLKDQFHVKDVETTMGYVGWIGTFEGIKDDPRKGTYESEMVKELRSLGAVLYCKTSVPHTLMSGETVNNIIGYTWNPKNRYICSGGSSGGEGALIGLKGSPGGFGTDIGGSIRIPAAFNGLFGIRPTSGRLPYEGMANSMDGQNSVLSVVGPLATTARSVKLLTKSILAQTPWLHDPLVVHMPWRDAEEQAVYDIVKSSSSKGQLTFAVMKSDGIVNPQPPVTRAVAMVVEALTSAGHKVIEWKPPSHERLLEIALKTWVYDGGKDVHEAFGLSGEPLSMQIKSAYGEKPIKEFTASEISANNRDKRSFQKEYMDYWNSTAQETGTGKPVDGVICPVAPFPAARPEKYSYYGYSVFVNGLDYTSVVVPVTTSDKTKDQYAEGYKPINDEDKKVYESYDAEIYEGAHVSVQIVGRRYTEEKMLAIAEYVGGLIGK